MRLSPTVTLLDSLFPFMGCGTTVEAISLLQPQPIRAVDFADRPSGGAKIGFGGTDSIFNWPAVVVREREPAAFRLGRTRRKSLVQRPATQVSMTPPERRGQAEKDFRMEVATISRVRHKNLVSLLGYCCEGSCRMLVYQYMDNSNLDKWLHHDASEISPLTWDIRMRILLGTAKGLAYLHEGLEPKIVHRDIKSSNILLDRHWNAKVSDFGLAKLLCSERSHVTTRVMGTFGYVAPEYAKTGMLNERSDVYSFGVLVMEIITGRTPVDYTRPADEVNLVDWLKRMVVEGSVEEVLDPRLPEDPPSKALKRVVLAALRCVDLDAGQRPTMTRVVHMLEDDQILREELKIARDLSHSSDQELDR